MELKSLIQVLDLYMKYLQIPRLAFSEELIRRLCAGDLDEKLLESAVHLLSDMLPVRVAERRLLAKFALPAGPTLKPPAP